MSGWYEALVDGKAVLCQPRGRFKIESQEVLAGDRVNIRMLDDGTGYLEEVMDRTNSLIRPPIANIDRVVAVFTLKEPAFNPLLVDRMAVYAGVIKCKLSAVLNKIDLIEAHAASEIERMYEGAGCDFFKVSAKNGEGIDDLRHNLKAQISVLAGQSGVGKSKLLNRLAPGADRRTGDVSRRLGVGRHTTRHVELIATGGGGVIADTPGFSLLEPPPVGKWELSSFVPEIYAYEPQCRFTDCLHRDEPDCAVKDALESGRIPRSRYQSYLTMLAEIEEVEARRY